MEEKKEIRRKPLPGNIEEFMIEGTVPDKYYLVSYDSFIGSDQKEIMQMPYETRNFVQTLFYGSSEDLSELEDHINIGHLGLDVTKILYTASMYRRLQQVVDDEKNQKWLAAITDERSGLEHYDSFCNEQLQDIPEEIREKFINTLHHQAMSKEIIDLTEEVEQLKKKLKKKNRKIKELKSELKKRDPRNFDFSDMYLSINSGDIQLPKFKSSEQMVENMTSAWETYIESLSSSYQDSLLPTEKLVGKLIGDLDHGSINIFGENEGFKKLRIFENYDNTLGSFSTRDVVKMTNAALSILVQQSIIKDPIVYILDLPDQENSIVRMMKENHKNIPITALDPYIFTTKSLTSSFDCRNLYFRRDKFQFELVVIPDWNLLVEGLKRRYPVTADYNWNWYIINILAFLKDRAGMLLIFGTTTVHHENINPVFIKENLEWK